MSILVGYVRVSGDAQEDNFSIPIQKQAIQDFCKTHKHTLFNTFEDVSSAAFMNERQGFQFALNCVFKDLADGLIVYRLDRFARKLLHAEFIKEKLKEHNKVLISVTDPIDMHMPDGELFYHMKSAFAEFERKNIVMRCEAGRNKKRESNGYYGGHPPYGWIARQGTLIPYEPEQRIIKYIYRLRADNYTLKAIACMLNDEGYTTKRGRSWRYPQVQAVLKGVPEVVTRLGA